MNRRRGWWLALSLALAGCSISVRAAEANVTRDELEGQALAADVRSQAPGEDADQTGRLRLRLEGGKRATVPVRIRVAVSETFWSVSYDATPTNGPAETLVIKHHAGSTNEFLHSRASGSNLEPVAPARVSGAVLYQPFSGSDFWLADLGLEFLHWPVQRRLKGEMRKSRFCRKLESLNPAATGPAYARVVSWLDGESGSVLLAQAYDAAGRRVKSFAVNSVKKVNGRWELREIEIRNELTDTVTRLEFDLPPKTP